MALYKIYSHLSSDKIYKMLPHLIRKSLDQNLFSDSTDYSLILFPVDGKVVLRSPDVKKAINEIQEDSTEQVVVVANKLSREATAMIEKRGFTLLALQTDFWTDDSIIRVKIDIAKRH